MAARSSSDAPDLGDMDPRAYIRLARQLENDIEDGTLAAGTPAPTITCLVQQTGHARQTCSKALKRLEDKGLLQRYAGLGYYVRHPGRTGSGTDTASVKAAPDRAGQARQRVTPARGPGLRTPAAAPLIFRPPARTAPRQEQRPASPAPATAVPAAPGTPQKLPPGEDYDLTASPGEQLLWLLAPEGDASERAAAELAARYKTTLTLAGCTPVPARWLHVTVGCAGPADELTAGELARMTGIVRERCARLPQLTVTAGPAQVTPAGLVCPVGPAAALRGLQKITADACTAIGRAFPAPRKPHIVLARAVGDATPGQTGPPLPARGKHHIRAPALLLARVRTDGQQLTWRTVEKITVGRVRGTPS